MVTFGTCRSYCQGWITHTQLSIVQHIDSPSSESEDRLLTTVERFWEAEAVGTFEQSEFHDQDYREPFLQNLSFHDNHYEVSLPWIRDPHDVPSHHFFVQGSLEDPTTEVVEET